MSPYAEGAPDNKALSFYLKKKKRFLSAPYGAEINGSLSTNDTKIHNICTVECVTNTI